MRVSPDYRDHVLDQLACLGRVRGRSMFGGVGIYLDDLFFALIADDVLYFKVDDTTRGAYEARGMAVFKPNSNRSTIMAYYEVPAETLEDTDQLRTWGRRAVEVASRARATHPTRGRPRGSVQSKKKPSKGGSR
jgi:DNA transformation protein